MLYERLLNKGRKPSQQEIENTTGERLSHRLEIHFKSSEVLKFVYLEKKFTYEKLSRIIRNIYH